MRFLSSLCCCIRNPSDDERPEIISLKNGAGTSSLAKSPQELPYQTLPILDDPFPGSSRRNDKAAAAVVVPAVELEPPHYTVTDSQSLLEYWKLDGEFLPQIREWNQNHPEKKLTRIFKAIFDKLDPDSPVLELFPDNLLGVPIRGTIKCLIHVCKLTADAASAKKNAIAFMSEIVTWLEELACTFDGGSQGQLESKAWKSLEDMGKIIKDACNWASELLDSGILTRQRFSVKSEIQKYRDEFTRTAQRFGITSILLLAQGMDNVQRGVDNVQCGVDNVQQGVDDVQRGVDDVQRGVNDVQHGVDNVARVVVTVAQNTHTMAETENADKRLKFLKEKLLLRLIENVSYNHQKKRPCELGTRVEVLDEITRWFEDVSEKSQCFYWLSGQPGVGKSAITASIARDCLGRKILGTQFFISRNDATTTDPRALFPTICWELCQRFPQVAVVMERTLQDQPMLIDEISDDQAAKLFVEGVETAAATDRSRAVAVVIDALDETDTKHLRRLAQILSKVVANLPQNAKVLISSRTEDAITHPFNLALCGHERVKTRHLTAKDSIDEVPRFMKKKVKEILDDYSIDWADWGDDRMKRFSSKASGLYIWAETALKYLRAEIENSGVTCFKRVLDVTDNCMDDINDLYLKIIRETCKPGDWEYQRFRRIVGAILVRQVSLPIAAIGQLLDLKDPKYSDPVDLVHFLRQYRTVLVDDTKEINGSVVPRMHKSFTDFITSERAGEFRVDVRESHGELALQCINQLENVYMYARLNEGEQERPVFPSQLVYASQHWQSHLTRMIEPDMDKDAGEKKEYEKNDTQDLPAESHGMKDWKPDREEIERKTVTPLTLGFSPDGAQFASAHGRAVRIWDAKTGTVTMSLTGHGRGVRSVGFSPDGTQLVSASFDRTVRIWDVQTGRELHVLCGHTGWVFHAEFSHDGRTVVTCSDDNTVRTWDSTTGQQLNVFEGHTETVDYCTFSPNDQRIMSPCAENECIVWDVNSGDLISKFKHDGLISFCPCGGHLISRDRGETKLCDVESGNRREHAQFLDARLAFVDDSEQESTTTYIHVPPKLKPGSNIPQVYSLKTKYGDVWGMVEHDHPEGVWQLLKTVRKVNENKRMKFMLSFAAGATVMNGLFRR